MKKFDFSFCGSCFNTSCFRIFLYFCFLYSFLSFFRFYARFVYSFLSFGNFVPDFIILSFNFKISPLLYLGIISSKSTFIRFQYQKKLVFSHDLFKTKVFVPKIFIPKRQNFSMAEAEVISNCDSDTQRGLSCRVRLSLLDFLKTGIPWYGRLIDDSFINPLNLRKLINDLETFIDPFTQIVGKSLINRHRCSPKILSYYPYINGGNLILLSRAAVEHMMKYNFRKVYENSLRHQDDTAISDVFYETFFRTSDWEDFRFTGPEDLKNYLARNLTSFILRHVKENFSNFHQKCRAPEDLQFPFSTSCFNAYSRKV